MKLFVAVAALAVATLTSALPTVDVATPVASSIIIIDNPTAVAADLVIAAATKDPKM